MRLIDTHCHLAHGELRDQQQAVLRRAREAGVVAIICATGDLDEAEAALALSRREPMVAFMAGIHPHGAKDAGAGHLDRIERLACEDRFVAIGEVGLDYHYDFSPREDQRRIFAEQLALAARIGARVVIHTREAFDDTMGLLADSGLDASRAVFHSFTGPPDQTARVLETGAMVSFSGIVTFKRADDIRASAAMVPDGRLLVETDAPYLSPEPVRKMKVNEPANVLHVAARLAAVRGTTLETVAEQTAANAARFFRLAV